MRVLKPGQKVTLYQDELGQRIEGRIRYLSLWDDGSVQYTCRWWADGEPYEDTFSESELEEPIDAKYIEISEE